MALTTNFVAGWEFDEASGTTCAEVSGNGSYAGTSTNCSVVAGAIGNARQFTGSTGQNIQVPSSVWSSGIGASTTAVTELIRIKITSSGAATLFRQDGENGNCGLHLGIDGSGHFSTFQNCTGSYAFPPTGSTYLSTTGATALSTGVWYDLCAVWDGTYTTLYINGSQDAQVNQYAASGSGYHTIYMAGFSTYYTGYFGHNQQSNNNAFNGLVDAFYVWNRALSLSEVQSIYNSGSWLAYASWGGGSSAPVGKNIITNKAALRRAASW